MKVGEFGLRTSRRFDDVCLILDSVVAYLDWGRVCVSIHSVPTGFCRMLELNLRSGQYVGVHIRRGDKGQWRVDNTGTRTVSLFFSVGDPYRS